ncbi:MAG: outer membrane protein assembly factor BamE [Rhodoferax sp.]
MLQRFAPLALALSLAACASLAPSGQMAAVGLSPYKIDIIQGNVVTREQVQVLRAGMSRLQVRDVLGSPLLTSVFHGDRWDYVFTLQRQGAAAQSRRVTVFFRGDGLDRVDADELPSEKEFVSTLRTRVPQGPVPVLEAPAASTDTAPPQRAATTTAAAATGSAGVAQDPAAHYPPLEASR